ncbi:MAG: DUF2220 family protein [Bacillota bacterium]|nr:DUF2220 family protein [Bacillota bacterium]
MGKKILTLSEIQRYFNIDDYIKLTEFINSLINEGILCVVKTSGLNGMNPPLYNKYRAADKKENLDSILSEINYNFPIEFQREYYLNNIKKYMLDKVYLEKLILFYREKRESLMMPMSINERSFAIWGEEKFLKDGRGQSILKNIGISIDALNIYRTPEPFVYFSLNKSKNQVVLIIENKDTWYTLRKLMIEGKNTFLGERIDTIIYGAGKNIEKSLEEYEYTVEKYLLNPAEVYYFGDLDFEGIAIYERVNKKYRNKLNIQLYKSGYQAMIMLSRKVQLSKCSEKQNKNIGEVFLSDMEPYRSEILSILRGGFYIPQEIVNYMVLKEDNSYV